MKFFLFRYSIISILSFILSNILYNLFLIKFHETYAALFSLFLILNLNIFFFFRLKIFKTSKKNYLKIVSISIFFRIFEYLLFSLLFFYLFKEIQSSYIFAITLILSFLFKSIVFYNKTGFKITSMGCP